jgi:hypothetical protein
MFHDATHTKPRRAQTMRSLLVALLPALVGCREDYPPSAAEGEVSAGLRLERQIESGGDITFNGWNGRNCNLGAHFRLSFMRGHRVRLDTLGYNFVWASGHYRVEDGSRIVIVFERHDASKRDALGYEANWPMLRIKESRGYFHLYREDGKRAWHLDWPLYPEIMQDLWPLRVTIQGAAVGLGGYPLTRP